MSLFKKTLLECLAVFAVGGLVIGLVLAIDVIRWERIVYTDTTLLLCCLIVLLSVPVLYYGYKRKAETLSAEAQEAIRWVQFGMMFLLFLGILTCVFRNPGAVVVAVCFTLSAVFLGKILRGKTYDKGEGKGYKSKNWELAALSVALAPFSLLFIMLFADPALLKGNSPAGLLPVYTFLAVANYVKNVK